MLSRDVSHCALSVSGTRPTASSTSTDQYGQRDSGTDRGRCLYQDVRLLLEMAKLHEKRGDIHKALTALEKAVAGDKYNPYVYQVSTCSETQTQAQTQTQTQAERVRVAYGATKPVGDVLAVRGTVGTDGAYGATTQVLGQMQLRQLRVDAAREAFSEVPADLPWRKCYEHAQC
eukprot:3835935-Rhodomonas_salina.4